MDIGVDSETFQSRDIETFIHCLLPYVNENR